MTGQVFYETLYVNSNGVVMQTNRVFFLHAAVEELQTTGYLCEQTYQSLNKDELMLVQERARAKDSN